MVDERQVQVGDRVCDIDVLALAEKVGSLINELNEKEREQADFVRAFQIAAARGHQEIDRLRGRLMEAERQLGIAFRSNADQACCETPEERPKRVRDG